MPRARVEAGRRIDITSTSTWAVPPRRVAGGLAGSALMRDLGHAMRIIEAVVAAVAGAGHPTKMRLGWDENSLECAGELARRPPRPRGVALISVHGRTRCQFYAGPCRLGGGARAGRRGRRHSPSSSMAIALGSPRTLRAMLAQSGAKALMVGRAAIGAPWLAGQISQALASGAPLRQPRLAARREAALEHFETLLGLFGAYAGLRHARKHLSAYAEQAGASAAQRLALVTCRGRQSGAPAFGRGFRAIRARSGGVNSRPERQLTHRAAFRRRPAAAQRAVPADRRARCGRTYPRSEQCRRAFL